MEPWGRRWLTNQLGVDLFGKITMVTFGERCVTEEAPVRLGAECIVDRQNSRGFLLSDSEQRPLEGLVGLQVLNLAGTASHLTCVSLVSLEGLTDLEATLLARQDRGSKGIAGLVHLKGHAEHWRSWASGALRSAMTRSST